MIYLFIIFNLQENISIFTLKKQVFGYKLGEKPHNSAMKSSANLINLKQNNLIFV